MKVRKHEESAGFSLIELLVTFTLLVLIMGSVYSLFAYNQKAYSVQDQIMGRDQMVLACNELLGREARGAGLKLDPLFAGKLNKVASMIPAGFLPTSPAPLSVTLNANDSPLKITPGNGSNPDAVTIIGAIGDKTNPTKVANDPAMGDTTITLNLTAMQTQALYSVGEVIYIGEEIENAKITAINGNQLTVDTDPGLGGNQGLTKNHAPWAEVGKLSVISYEIFTNGSVKSLQRKENTGNFEAVGENITDLQATQTGKNTKIEFTGQTAFPDSDYSLNGGYRQKVVSINVAPKNIK
jgi:type II secretory pathway pseudopilin PulG